MTITPEDRAKVEQVGDRLEALAEQQRQRVLRRIASRFPEMVDRVINELERAGWDGGH